MFLRISTRLLLRQTAIYRFRGADIRRYYGGRQIVAIVGWDAQSVFTRRLQQRFILAHRRPLLIESRSLDEILQIYGRQ